MSLLDIDFKGAIIAIPSEAKENMTTMNGKNKKQIHVIILLSKSTECEP